MALSSLPDNVIRQVLIGERSPVQFEHFCCDLFSDAHGHDYVPTSRSYDLGRDAGTSSTSPTGQVGVICCTTEDKIDRKAKDDITRVLESITPHDILFCTAQDKSEEHLQRIENELRAIAPQVSGISAFATTQLVHLVQRYPSSFERRYAAELIEHQSFLSRKEFATEEIQTEGLRLALATQFHSDAQALRSEVLTSAVLFALSDDRQHTIGTIAKGVSDRLRLPHIMHQAYFGDCLNGLLRQKAVCVNGGLFSITDAGHELVCVGDQRRQESAKEGGRLFRGELERLLGGSLGDQEFSFLWKRIQDELANLFFCSGLKLIRAIASLTEGPPLPEPSRSYQEMLSDLQKRIAGAAGGSPHAEETAQAVVDVLGDPASKAFEWITDIAVKYVTMCSLGLEPTAQQEVLGRLREMDLILDTDVVLTYLSQGERPHGLVEEMLGRWREIGGRLIVVPSVIEEAAYHAWIAEYEYNSLWRTMEELKPAEINRYAGNAFVRAFYHAAAGKFHPSNWSRFIAEYRGVSPEDTSRLQAILQDAGFDVVSDFQYDNDVASKVIDELYRVRGVSKWDYVPKRVGDKVARDGRLIAHLKYARQTSTSVHHTTVIVSSSPTLQNAAQEFAKDLMDPAPVWPIGAIGYLVSLVPGVKMTLRTLTSGLFVDSSQDSMDTVTRLAMRVIRQSAEYDLGFARRVTLKKAISAEINRAALQRGIRPGELIEQMIDPVGGERELLTEVIARGVDNIAASKHEKALDELRRRAKKSP